MKIFCSNNYIFEFFYNPFDSISFEEITGIKFLAKASDGDIRIDLKQKINGELFVDIRTTIQIDEAKELINWFKLIKENQLINYDIFFYHNRFNLKLLKNKNDNKKIGIIYDRSKPIPGVGGYSGNLEDFNKIYTTDFEVNLSEIKEIIFELEKELFYSKD